jgi:hypothetical protein
MSCNSESPAVSLTSAFFLTDSAGNYYVVNYTTKQKDGVNNTSCLPTTGTPPVSSFPASSIDSAGTVLSSKIVEQVNLLARERARAPEVLTPSNNDPIATFAADSARLRAAIKAEYCYYYNRYAFILNDFLLKKASTSTEALGEKQKACVIYLNSVLNQILQVYQGLINSRNSTVDKYYSDSGVNINSLNDDVTKSRESLQAQSSMLENANLEADVQSAMIEYSLEKNQSSRNLLVIYGFMNLVAAGLIVYLYRTTGTQ